MKRWKIFVGVSLGLCGILIAVSAATQALKSNEAAVLQAQQDLVEISEIIQVKGATPELLAKQAELEGFLAQKSGTEVKVFVDDKPAEITDEAMETAIEEAVEVALPDPEEVYYQSLVERLNRGHQLSEMEKEDFIAYEESHPYRDNPLDDTGGPSNDGYRWVDNLGGDTATFAWEELDTTAGAISLTAINESDDANAAIAWGWNFNFFGVAYTSAFVTTNGYIGFGAGTSDLSNDCRRSAGTPSGPAIFAYWDDLHPSHGGPGVPDEGRLVYQDFGDHVTVTWDSVGSCCTAGADLLDFQVQLWDDGKIKLQYRQIQKNTGTSTNGASPTIGIQETNNAGGGDSLIYHCATTMDTAYTNALDGRAVWFYQFFFDNDFRAVSVIEPNPLRVEPGEVFEVIGRFGNVGNISQSSPVAYSFNGGTPVTGSTGTLDQFDTEDVDFAGTETAPLVVGDYTLQIWSDLAGDEDTSNDTVTVIVQVRNCYDETQTDAFADTSSTTGAGNDFDATCMGTFDTGQDYIYQWNVTAAGFYSIWLNRTTTGAMGLGLHSDCPPDMNTCLRFLSTTSGTELFISCVFLDAGTYYIMVDNNSTTLTYNFTIRTEVCDCDPNDSQTDGFTSSATTIGSVNDYNATCMGSSDTGEDYVIEWTTTTGQGWNLLLTTGASTGLGMAVHSDCPPDSTTCLAFVGVTNDSAALNCIPLDAGTYYIILDRSTAGGYAFTLQVSTCTTLGRCCYNAGDDCADTTSYACLQLGGTWNSTLTCAANPCPIDLEGGETCADAVPVPVAATVTLAGTTTGHLDDDPGFQCALGSADPYEGSNTAEDVWYVLAGNGNTFTISSCAAIGYDTQIGVFCGDCNELFCAGGNDDAACTFSGLRSTLTLCTELGRDYFIVMDGWGAADGAYNLTITDNGACNTPPPCNNNGRCCYEDGESCLDTSRVYCETVLVGVWDSTTTCASACPAVLQGADLCEDAVAIPGFGSFSGTTAGSTPETGIPVCGTGYNTAASGVWYSVTGTGNDITVDLCDPLTNYDSELFVFCGSCDELFCVGGDDDACVAPGLASTLTFCSALGEEYLILVTAFGTATGTYMLTLTEGAPCEDPPFCEPPVGRCCYDEGLSCINTTQDDCETNFAGDWTLGLACETDPCPIPPPNDDCGSAQVLVLVPNDSVAVTVDNTNADVTCSDTCDFDSNSPDVFYQFTVTNCRRIAIRADGPGIDSHLSIYSDDSCCVAPAICCNDDYGNFGENGCLVPAWDDTTQHPTQAGLASYIAAELGPGTFIIRAGSFGTGTDIYELTVFDNGPCVEIPCDPVTDLAVTVITVADTPDHLRLHFTAPQPHDYIIWSATNPNNDGDPDEGADVNFTVEAVLPGLAAGPQTWDAPTGFPVNYKNYVITADCGE